MTYANKVQFIDSSSSKVRLINSKSTFCVMSPHQLYSFAQNVR